jgi:competence protein ComGC
MDAIANAATKRKRKLTALPLLVVLFVISYLLLTKLVIEQDKTIDSQRNMIHMLFNDNTYLTGLHKHAAVSSKKPKSQDSSQLDAQNSASQNPASASEPNHASSSQIPLAQVPSSKAGPQANAKTGRRTRTAEKAIPASPPPEPTDPSDQRRVSFSI